MIAKIEEKKYQRENYKVYEICLTDLRCYLISN